MDKFKGVWVSTKQDNLDGFLKALGAGLFARGAVKAFTMTLDIDYDGECTFTVKLNTGPISREQVFRLGEIKNEIWPVGGPVVGGWDIEGDELVGKFKAKDNKEIVIRRSIEDDIMLVQRMSVETVSCTRWFKKKQT